MKKIVINDNKLSDNDIEEEVIRVKGLIINSSGKILLAHNNNTYQFPGGHKEDDEGMDECIEREIKEETGIKIFVKEKPFLCIETYDNNYFGSSKKVKNSIYYYRFLTDNEPNFNETHYDQLELATDFNLFYVDYNDLDNFLKNSLDSDNIDPNILREMLIVIDEYNKIFGGI